MANPTTAGSGDRSRRAGSSETPSPPTGPRAASARSEPSSKRAKAPRAGTKRRGARRARKSSGRRLFAFDRRLESALVAGADEAGRGCLAGPLVAAGVLFDYERITPAQTRALSALNDSKQHTQASREALYPLVMRTALRVSVIFRSAPAIDAIGLHRTNLAALHQALASVTREAPGDVLCLVDGFSLAELEHPQRAIVDGDATSAAIAAASIVAKVTRDRFMHRADQLHPGWGFAEHVGYSTPMHREAIGRQGLSPLHRTSFQSLAYSQLCLEDVEAEEVMALES